MLRGTAVEMPCQHFFSQRFQFLKIIEAFPIQGLEHHCQIFRQLSKLIEI
jgi:hypothetical protein